MPGKSLSPGTLQKAPGCLRELFGAQFPGLDDAGWLAWARRSWRQDSDGLVSRYDQTIAETLNDFSPDQPMPDLWPQFDALPQVPLMVIRGGLSDILSAETVDAMRQRRADIELLEVPDQGHAPLLAERAIIARISDFLLRCDRFASL